ncbi:putative RNA-binding protein RbpE [Xenia sp. Carnegie-2017]|uniref:putative RNA-binding protein RbpE n=1 Tax=Xenia sp. Carnegie-2017 TaxID=2897299 RepID=UPI001F04AC0B|nr:putative RNA-binding protein RbpE [Xenia sp. Carnegie-2017]
MPEDAKIHVGNLPFETREDDLIYEFERYGRVEQATIIKDRDTGRPKGYGFVMFENVEDARDAIYGMDQKKFMGRVIKCEKAKPRRSELGASRDSFDRRDDRGFRDDRRGEREYRGGRDDFRGSRDNFRGRDDHRGRDNFRNRDDRDFRGGRGRDRRF